MIDHRQTRFKSLIRAPRLAILAAWVAFSAWFIRAEIFPHGLFAAPAGYDAIIHDGLLHRDSWMRILDGERIVGYSNSRIDIDEFAINGQYLLFNRTVADLPFWGSTHRTFVESRISLDSERLLEEFSLSIHSADQPFRVIGKHVGNGTFEIETAGALNLPTMRIALPRNAMILPPTAELAVRDLRPGRKTTLQIFDPFTLRTSTLTIEALRRETRVNDGQSTRVTVLAAHHGGGTLHSWVDDQGNLLRQETPLGWVLEACEPADALDFIRPSSP